MAGGAAEARAGDRRRLGVQGLQDAPDPRFAGQEIGIGDGAGFPGEPVPGDGFPAEGGDAAADQPPDRERRAEEVRFLLADRAFARETGEDRRRGGKRVQRFAGGVERRRRGLHDGRRAEGVPEVEEREVSRPGGFRFPGDEEQVVVVRVVVDRGARQREKPRPVRERPLGKPPVELPPPPFGNRLHRCPEHPFRVPRRPGDVRDFEPGVVKTGERPPEAADQPADRRQQGRGRRRNPDSGVPSRWRKSRA